MQIAGAGWLGLLVLVVAQGACTSEVRVIGHNDRAGTSLCALQCACRECTHEEASKCREAMDDARAEATAKGCRPAFEAVETCYIDHFACDEANNAVVGPSAADCGAEDEELFTCISAGTGGASTGPSTTAVTTGGSPGCEAFVALCVSCGLDQATCEEATEGATDAECWAGYEQLIAAGC